METLYLSYFKINVYVSGISHTGKKKPGSHRLGSIKYLQGVYAAHKVKGHIIQCVSVLVLDDFHVRKSRLT